MKNEEGMTRMLSGWTRKKSVVLGTVAALTLSVAQSPAFADPTGAWGTMAWSWGVNGRVLSIDVKGDTVVLGGEFNGLIGPSGDQLPSSGLAKYHPSTGLFADWPVTVDGPVHSIAIDGSTVYLGGDFRKVNGVNRTSLAAVSLTDGSLLPWAPAANVSVYSLAVLDGFVYAGGPFTAITDSLGTATVSRLARMSTTTGTVDRTWSTLPIDGPVRAIVPTADGTGVYVGGDFYNLFAMPDTSRVVLVSTGALPTIDPVFRSGPNNEGNRSPVYDLALSGSSLLLAVGGSGGACTLQNAVTGATQWSYHTNGNVVGAAFLGPKSYCGGHFTGNNSFGTYGRNKIAEVVAATGQVTGWDPVVNSAQGVFTLTGDSTGLYVGGDFTKVGATLQSRFGMFYDQTTIGVSTQPLNLNARAGSGQVLLTWDRPHTDHGARIMRYKVYRARGSGPYTLLGSAQDNSYLDTSVINGTTGDPSTAYTYYVSAVNAVGSSPPSSLASATPINGLVTTPSAPMAADAVGAYASSQLTWAVPLTDGGAPITGYTIYRGETYGSLTPLETVPASQLSYTDSNVVVNRRYYYQIAAVNALGEGVLTKQVAATPSTGVPGAPTLTAAQVGSSVALDWVPSSMPGATPTTRYTVIRNGIRIANLSGSTFELTDSAVSVGNTYVYQVKAVNSYGSSKWSVAASVTVN